MIVATKRISEAALAVLSTGTLRGNEFFITAGQLDPKLYKEVNVVLENLGGKWNRKARSHIFDADPADRLDEAIVTGGVETQAAYGFFPTPPTFAEHLVALADVRPGMTCLEPSAGTGNIAYQLALRAAWPNVDLVEIQPHLCAELAGQGGEVRCADFLTLAAFPDYDRVVMNPPFARQQDIAHVLHAYDHLKPGGKLVSVMAAGVLFREDRKARDFRLFVMEHGQVERNPEGTFKESGTLVQTVTVQLEKQP